MPLFRYTFHAMAAQHELQLVAPARAVADRAAEAAIADVRRIEAKFSRYRDDSVTSAINRAAGGMALPIDAETAALIRYGAQCHAESGGAFDLTSGVLRRVWDFRARPPRVPEASEVAAALACVGWASVEWDDATIRLPRPGMEIDFGGIGKEYAADRAVAIVAQRGIASALVNLGGDVRALGAQESGAPWRVGIAHPRLEDAVIGEVELVDGAVATSGDYQRYFDIGDRRYCHILDARTGFPVAHWQSASVVAPLCTLAGTLATLAMLRPDAEAFLRPRALSFLLVRADGAVIR